MSDRRYEAEVSHVILPGKALSLIGEPGSSSERRKRFPFGPHGTCRSQTTFQTVAFARILRLRGRISLCYAPRTTSFANYLLHQHHQIRQGKKEFVTFHKSILFDAFLARFDPSMAGSDEGGIIHDWSSYLWSEGGSKRRTNCIEARLHRRFNPTT